MWDLGNRGVVALVSVLSGCVFLYNVWGPILVLAISLCITIYLCYSLIINDSLLLPDAFLVFDYCKHVSGEAYANLERIIDHVHRYARKFWQSANGWLRERYITKASMDRRRGSHYQLSSDAYSTPRSAAKFGFISQLSPIPKPVQKLDGNSARSEQKFCLNSSHASYDQNSFPKQTSTPVVHQNSPDLLLPDRVLSKKLSPMYARNSTLQDENSMYFPSEGTSWGTSVSPKVCSHASDSKSLQTISRPLSASNKYNIDAKTYNDVTSPGLTTRLTKYAAEASNKLNQQTHYRVGQFPKVNLNASPIPLINAKSVKTRTPVTVRVAPPDIIRCSPPGKQKILSNVCHGDNTCSSSNVAHALREISLKRHASREDVASELAKKQRTDAIMSKEFEVQDETKQKRSREESSKSEEDSSPQNKNARLMKRSKTPSCYDILNSLSSSKNVMSGVKRKARDFSRSGTPDFEKHFKSLECAQNTNVQTLSPIQNTNTKHYSHEAVEERRSDISTSSNKVQQCSPLKGILKTRNKNSEIIPKVKDLNSANTSSKKDQSMVPALSVESAKLTNKLFMRAEPERNERLRMLVEEQGNIRAKFTTDDVEEIKREDIADMRQTSMKARLQSMFDAISGKAASKINPDVVIQAEEVNAVQQAAATPVTCATLNSSTTTTNVNTTPISTSSIVPSPGSAKSEANSPKHVAFNLPSKESSSSAIALATSVSEAKVESPAISKEGTTVNKLGITFTSTGASSPMATNVSSTGTFLFAAVSSSSKPSTTITSPLVTPATTSLNENQKSNAPPKLSVTSASSASFNTKTEAKQNIMINSSQGANNLLSNSNFTFGGGQSKTTFVSANPVTSSTETKGHSTGNTSVIVTNTSMMPSKSVGSTVTVKPTIVTTTSAPAPLFTFGSQTSNLQASKAEPVLTFAFGSTGNALQSSNMFESSASSQVSNASNTIPNTLSNSVQSTVALNTSAFNSTAKMTTSAFGTSKNTAFSFGAPTTSAGSNSKTGFSFGTPASTTNTLAETTNTTTFGSGNNSSFTSSTTPQFSSNTTSVFGNTSTASIFGSASQPVFGTPSNLSTTGGTFSAVKSTATPIFGSNTGTTTASSTFSNTPSATTKTTNATPMPVFGSSTNASSSGVTGASSNLFSNVNPTTSTTTFGTTNNIFGQAKSPATAFKSSTGVFGSNTASLFGSQTQAATVATTTTTSTFGNTSIPSVTTTPTFGSAIVSNTNATLPSFGAPSTAATPVFGSQSNVALGAQSSTTPAFGSGTPIFRTDAAPTPVFGASSTGPFNSSVSNTFSGQNNPTNTTFGATTNTSTFGATTNTSTFGATTNTSTFGATTNTSTFGATTNTSTFGENKSSPFGSQTSAFGAPNTSVPAFRTVSTTNSGSTSGTANIFTFGANQKAPQQGTAFSFGNNANSNAAAPPVTPFQFNATTTSKPAAGFNFTAPTTAPSINFGAPGAPAFNASAPGMFNIGSGSTAPRSRNIRSRKPR